MAKVIGNIGIITNGTIMPDKRLLEVSAKYDIKYDFSDYTSVVDYKKRFEEAVKSVADAGLRYSVNRSLRWCDFGFPVNNRMYDFEEVRNHMLSCGPVFHGLNDGRYYYCHVSWSADKAKLLRTVSDDYVNLEALPDDDSAKEAILEHSKGNLAKGFVKLCKVVGDAHSGAEKVSAEIIEVGLAPILHGHGYGIVAEGKDVRCAFATLVGVHLFLVQAAYVVFHHAVAVGLYTAFVGAVAERHDVGAGQDIHCFVKRVVAYLVPCLQVAVHGNKAVGAIGVCVVAYVRLADDVASRVVDHGNGRVPIAVNALKPIQGIVGECLRDTVPVAAPCRHVA